MEIIGTVGFVRGLDNKKLAVCFENMPLSEALKVLKILECIFLDKFKV